MEVEFYGIHATLLKIRCYAGVAEVLLRDASDIFEIVFDEVFLRSAQIAKFLAIELVDFLDSLGVSTFVVLLGVLLILWVLDTAFLGLVEE